MFGTKASGVCTALPNVIIVVSELPHIISESACEISHSGRFHIETSGLYTS